MAIIAQIRIPADSFELGRILELESETTIQLEAVVPLGDKAVSFFSVSDEVRKPFENSVREHPSVDDLAEISRHGNEQLYSLRQSVSQDTFLQGVLEIHGQILIGKGTASEWAFELRFPTRDPLTEFQEYCSNACIKHVMGRVYSPVRSGVGVWYGLTPAQRETLLLAVNNGYYSIPRQVSTQELADELEISDQAVIERLRRAIETFVENTLLPMKVKETEEFTTPEE
jgi:predicted DNA binding protein